jgi:hypothetical protein
MLAPNQNIENNPMQSNMGSLVWMPGTHKRPFGWLREQSWRPVYHWLADATGRNRINPD